MKRYIIAGIHTDAGKTVTSALLCQALGTDYWKPVQSGEETDTTLLKSVVTHPDTVFHAEAFRLRTPVSPHEAAKIDNTYVHLTDLKVPVTSNNLIIETAGGLMSPINDDKTVLDLILHFGYPVILVSRNYLGSINHTLLTSEVLKKNNIPVTGIIFSGTANNASEEYILNYTGLPLLARIPQMDAITAITVSREAEKLKSTLQALIP